MKFNELIKKLSSRKLWISIAGVTAGIAMALGAEANDIQTVCGTVTSIVSAMTYIIAEASIDKAALLNDTKSDIKGDVTNG